MSAEWKVILEEPYWVLEAVLCMNWAEPLDDEEWLEKGDFWPRKQQEALLGAYSGYREAMRKGLEPVLAGAPRLQSYIDLSPRRQESLNAWMDSPIVEFLSQMQAVVEGDEALEGEAWTRRLNEAFQRILDLEGQKAADAAEPEIHGLTDVLRVLDGWAGTDADKFCYIRLYSEAAALLEELRGLRPLCREIGLSCLPWIQERYEACMERLRDSGELSSFFLEQVGIRQWEGEVLCRVCPALLRFNSIRFQGRAHEGEAGKAKPDNVTVYLGIEVFDRLERKQEAPYDDTVLLARLKAIGDSTRVKILHLLAERPYYLQELAKELGLTPATVSHHMGILLAEELIGLMVTGGKKRVYYQLQEEKLAETGRMIEKLGLSRAEQESTALGHMVML